VELQGRLAELQTRGLGLAVISYDSRDVLAQFSTRHGISYPLLSDAGSATIKRYGILNTVVEEALGPNGNDPAVREDVRRFVTGGQADARFRGIPFPGTFVLDREGRVTSRFFEDYYWERHTASNILMQRGAAGIPVHVIQASTEHLDLRAYPSDGTVVLGTRFSLVVEITPKRNMHLYAPGAVRYRVIALNVTPQPHVRVMPVEYPPSEIFHFRPLDERVPVYQKPFTLLQQVVPEATAEARKALGGKTDLVITGTLDYQACDDTICYNPVSVPLSWKVGLKGHVPGTMQPPRL
jgi:hypothetical protein